MIKKKIISLPPTGYLRQLFKKINETAIHRYLNFLSEYDACHDASHVLSVNNGNMILCCTCSIFSPPLSSFCSSFSSTAVCEGKWVHHNLPCSLCLCELAKKDAKFFINYTYSTTNRFNQGQESLEGKFPFTMYLFLYWLPLVTPGNICSGTKLIILGTLDFNGLGILGTQLGFLRAHLCFCCHFVNSVTFALRSFSPIFYSLYMYSAALSKLNIFL